MPQAQQTAVWVEQMASRTHLVHGNYFTGFAGQGRVRFHYGAAHAILIDIEKAYIADHGRNWLRDEREARVSLVLGQVDRPFVWFDGRQLWQIFSAFAIVSGTTAGAFILSYYTPTVGLSCRSGGYVIFAVVSFALLLLEFATWACTSPVRSSKQRRDLWLQLEHLDNRVPSTTDNTVRPTLLMRLLHQIERCLIKTVQPMSHLLPAHTERLLRNHFHVLRNLTPRQWTERLFFQPVEAFNTVWLIYLFMAQTIGAFNNCDCQTSIWAGKSRGGYLDFTQWQYSNSPRIQKYWIIGTVVSCVFMGLGIIYVVIEWCLQAHLSTEDYSNAMQGLKMVRWFRRCTYWVRYPATLVIMIVNHVASLLRLRRSSERKDLVWTRKSNYQPNVGNMMIRLASELHTMPFKEVEATVAAEARDIEKAENARDEAREDM